LDQTGTYSVAVTDRNFTQTGDYTFSFNRLNNPPGGLPITYGQEIGRASSRDTVVDFVAFTGADGERLLVRLTGTFVPAAAVRRPDGTSLCSTDRDCSNFLQLECALDQAGTYAVSVTDRNFTQTGDYTFSFNRLNNPPGGLPITYGQ